MTDKNINIDKWNADTLKGVGLDLSDFNQEQVNHLCQPFNAPENYYMDGEITTAQADAYWKQGLIKLGITGSNFKKALKLIR